MASNGPYQASALAGLAQMQPGAMYPSAGSGIYTSAFPTPGPTFPHTTMPIVGNFRVQKIANGLVVDIVKYEGGTVEQHFVEDFKQAGELITAMCVRWEIEGKK